MHACPCGKTYARVDNLTRHMKACTKVGPSLICECGAAFRTMDAFHAHQDGCILSPTGATKAVKRRFEGIFTEMPDAAEAELQALRHVVEIARSTRTLTCTKCGGGFANVESLKRHRRKLPRPSTIYLI